MGLDGALRAKGNRFIGILNGIDPDVWDPATDPALAAPYSRDVARRARPPAGATCSARLGFDPDDDGVVLGMIGRMDPQKGFDLLADGDAGAARRRARGSSSRAAATRPSPIRSGRSRPTQPVARRADRALRPRHGPPDLRRRRPVPDALALRALRPGPDDRAPLRDAARRSPDRRASPTRWSTWTRAAVAGHRVRVRCRDAGGPRRRGGARRGLAGLERRGWDAAARPGHGGRLPLGDGLGAALRRGYRRAVTLRRGGA